MPPEWYAIDGAQMTKDLRQRRDGIVAYSRKFYLHLADRVDVRATDRDDLASVEHFERRLAAADAVSARCGRQRGRGLLPAPLLAEGDAGDPPLPAGRQRPAGRERAAQGGIHLPCSAAGATTRWTTRRAAARDARRTPRGATSFLRGPGTKVSESEWKNPAPEPDRPWLEPRNYGHWTVPMLQVYWQPNQEFMLGGGPHAHVVGLPQVSLGQHAEPDAPVLDRLQQRPGELRGPVAAQRPEPARLAGRALLGNREHELLRLRKRDAEDRGQRRSTGPRPTSTRSSLRCASGRAPASSCTWAPRRRSWRRRAATAWWSSSRRTGPGTSAKRPHGAGFEYDSRGRSVGMTEQRGMAAPDASAASAAPEGERRPPARRGLLRPEGRGT